MYINRDITNALLRLSKQYPVVTITGPRQSGKTTLSKRIFCKHEYVSLEDISNRSFAEEDPKGFLERYNNGVIIDEIQRVPHLLSYIQTIVDEKDKKGLFILTGSNQFELMSSINQSLAGRTAIIKLLPLSYNELYKDKSPTVEEVIYKGFYPRIHKDNLNPTEMYSFYINTYVERDVRQIMNVQDLSIFIKFLKICAGRTGQIINYSSISNECGVDHKTVKKWLSVLETSYVIKLLQPYYRNINKRVTKSPKLYFYDTGLVCFLLGVNSPEHLNSHPLSGAIFETYVVSDIWKNYYNNVMADNLFYFHDSRGKEVDVIFDKVVSIDQMEIKMSKTINSSYFDNMSYLKSTFNIVDRSFLIYGGDESLNRSNVQIMSWRKITDYFI